MSERWTSDREVKLKDRIDYHSRDNRIRSQVIMASGLQRETSGVGTRGCQKSPGCV